MSYNTDLQSNNEELAEILQAVNELPEAVGGLPEGDFSDPDYVYAVTRPKDWLPLPVPGDTEMYFLGHLMRDIDNQFLIKLAFQGDCTIEFGNLVSGVFVAKESVSPMSGVMFYHKLNYDDYGDETEEGHRQYITRITGSKINGIRGGENTTDIPAYIVEFVCGIPLSVFSVNGGQANYNWNKTFASTRYIRFVGNGKTGILSCGFMYASQLNVVTCEGKNDEVYGNYEFYRCKRLVAVSRNLFQAKTTRPRMFSGSSINKLPKEQMTVTDASYMFADSALESFDGAFTDTSLAANCACMFQACDGLRSVENLNISALTNSGSMFSNCINLQKLTFAGETTPGRTTIDLTRTALSHTALVHMLNSLPTATNAATITITNNPGVSELTDEEIAVATAKNWTVTI